MAIFRPFCVPCFNAIESPPSLTNTADPSLPFAAPHENSREDSSTIVNAFQMDFSRGVGSTSILVVFSFQYRVSNQVVD